MRNAQMITIVIHDRRGGAQFRPDLSLIAHVLRKPPWIRTNAASGARTLVFAMSREEWEREFPDEAAIPA